MTTFEVVEALLGAPLPAIAASHEVYKALKGNKLLSFHYDEQLRVIEPHSFGITKDGNLAVRGYQVSGESSQPLPGWRMFRLDKFEHTRALATDSGAPRTAEGFKSNDKHLKHILLEIAQ
jgi:predicted DNA-binding transcriptional regulator YafY